LAGGTEQEGATIVAKNTTAEAEQPKVKKPKKDKPEKTNSADTAGYNLAGPASGGNFVPKDHTDELLLITPHEIREVSTTYGDSEAVEADIVILNAKKPAESEEIPNGLIFGKVVIGQLRQAVQNRSRVVGTLIEDTASQKKGQSAPYRLTAPSDADIEVAKAYLDALNPLR
jgi:hypothetical protein